MERWTLDGWPVWDDGDADLRQLDRFGCRWEDDDHVGFGPCCVPLDAALAWAASVGDRTVMASVDGRWNPDGDVRMGGVDEGWAVAWDHVPASEWLVTVRVSLGTRAFLGVAGRREDRCEDPVARVVSVEADHLGASVRGTVAVVAPTEALAADLGAHQLRRVLTEPDGLRDELGDHLAPRVEAVRPTRSQRA